jgi:hypothetical protein
MPSRTRTTDRAVPVEAVEGTGALVGVVGHAPGPEPAEQVGDGVVHAHAGPGVLLRTCQPVDGAVGVQQADPVPAAAIQVPE